MDLVQSKFVSLVYYSELKFKNQVLEYRECYEGIYGQSNPILVVKTLPLPEEYHLVYSTSRTICHYSIAKNQSSSLPISVDSLAKEICFGPGESFLSKFIVEEFLELEKETFEIGTFFISINSLALIYSTNPLKLILIKGEYFTVNSEVLMNIVNNIEKFIVKEVRVEEFYKDGPLIVHRLPFLIFKMNSVLKTVSERMDSKFEKLRNYMETIIPTKDKVFMNEYYQGVERSIKYLITIVNTGWIYSEFSIYFAFKSLAEFHNFKIGGEKTLEKALENSRSISSKLSSGQFQDDFRSELEIFKDYSLSELKSFNFRVGDCILRPKNGFIPLYYHHGIYIGCKELCKNSRKCNLCENIFHVTGGEQISETYDLWMKDLPKGRYEKISIENFIDGKKYLKIKRMQFKMLSKAQYHEKAEDIIKTYQDGINKKIPIDQKIKYNFRTNNCGHLVNSFENKRPDMGKHNKKRKNIVDGAGYGVSGAGVGGLAYGAYKLYESLPSLSEIEDITLQEPIEKNNKPATLKLWSKRDKFHSNSTSALSNSTSDVDYIGNFLTNLKEPHPLLNNHIQRDLSNFTSNFISQRMENLMSNLNQSHASFNNYIQSNPSFLNFDTHNSFHFDIGLH